LAIIYLQNVFDLWAHVRRQKVAHGEVIVIPYADDTVLGIQCQRGADRFLRDLRKRLKKFGLELHPDKTRRISLAAKRNFLAWIRKRSGLIGWVFAVSRLDLDFRQQLLREDRA
jgi:hypothetical protein